MNRIISLQDLSTLGIVRRTGAFHDRRIRRAVSILVAAATIAACGGGSESSIDDVPQTSIPSISVPSTINETSVAPTTAATTSTVVTPEALLTAATSDWATHVSALGGAVVFSEAVLIDGVPRAATFSARIDSEPLPVTIWRFDDAWRPEGDMSMDGDGFVNVTSIVAEDFTGDDSAELLVQFTPNRAAGAVFGFKNGAWEVYEVADALQADTDGLFGFENTCDPSCAAGNNRRFELVWDGTGFNVEYDAPVSQANPQPASPVECETYTTQQYEPFAKCSSGPAVMMLQEALVLFGYLEGGADGFFGAGTERAVRAAQRDYGVPDDGIATGSWYQELIETYNSER